MRTFDRDLDIEDLVAVLICDDPVGIHLLHQLDQIDRDLICFSGLLTPRSNQIVRAFIVKEREPVEIVLAEESLALHVLNDVKLEHLLTDHQHFLLIGAHSLSEPLQDLLASAALSVFPEPAVLVVQDLDVLVHDVGPLLQVLKLIFLDLRRPMTTTVVFLGNLVLLRLVNSSVVRVTLLLSVDEVDDFEHLVLDVVLVDEGQNVVFDGWEVRHLRNGRTLVVVFVQEGDD